MTSTRVSRERTGSCVAQVVAESYDCRVQESLEPVAFVICRLVLVFILRASHTIDRTGPKGRKISD